MLTLHIEASIALLFSVACSNSAFTIPCLSSLLSSFAISFLPALEGREAFWNSKNPYDATLYFNKGYVRPAEEQARINRAEEAAKAAKSK